MTLSRRETNALVVFWNKYMRERKAYEEFQQLNDYKLDYTKWLMYLEAKQAAFEELVQIIPEIRYTYFWRFVQALQPQAVVDDILRYRKAQQAEEEQKAKEKSILAGMKIT